MTLAVFKQAENPLVSTSADLGNGSSSLREGVGRKRWITARITLASIRALGAVSTGSIDLDFDFPESALLTNAGIVAPIGAGGGVQLSAFLEVDSTNVVTLNNVTGAAGPYSVVMSNPVFAAAGDIEATFDYGASNLNTVTGLDDDVLVTLEYILPPLAS